MKIRFYTAQYCTVNKQAHTRRSK